MKTLVIQSKSEKNIQLLFELATQMGDKPFIQNEASQSLDRGIKDLKAILSGKKKAKTLDELLTNG